MPSFVAPDRFPRYVGGGRLAAHGLRLAAALLVLGLAHPDTQLPFAAAQPLGAQQPATSAERSLDLEMYWDLQTVGSPQISPDGRQVVYTRGWIDRKNDRRRSEIWIMDAGRRVTSGGSRASARAG